MFRISSPTIAVTTASTTAATSSAVSSPPLATTAATATANASPPVPHQLSHELGAADILNASTVLTLYRRLTHHRGHLESSWRELGGAFFLTTPLLLRFLLVTPSAAPHLTTEPPRGLTDAALARDCFECARDDALPADAAHWARVAVASYTRRGERALLRALGGGFDRTDILFAQSRTRELLPAHVLLRDRRTRTLIISIRGTASIDDLITDLSGTVVDLRYTDRLAEPIAISGGESSCTTSSNGSSPGTTSMTAAPSSTSSMPTAAAKAASYTSSGPASGDGDSVPAAPVYRFGAHAGVAACSESFLSHAYSQAVLHRMLAEGVIRRLRSEGGTPLQPALAPSTAAVSGTSDEAFVVSTLSDIYARGITGIAAVVEVVRAAYPVCASWPLVCVGHSLGAGIATILTIRMRMMWQEAVLQELQQQQQQQLQPQLQQCQGEQTEEQHRQQGAQPESQQELTDCGIPASAASSSSAPSLSLSSSVIAVPLSAPSSATTALGILGSTASSLLTYPNPVISAMISAAAAAHAPSPAPASSAAATAAATATAVSLSPAVTAEVGDSPASSLAPAVAVVSGSAASSLRILAGSSARVYAVTLSCPACVTPDVASIVCLPPATTRSLLLPLPTRGSDGDGTGGDHNAGTVVSKVLGAVSAAAGAIAMSNYAENNDSCGGGGAPFRPTVQLTPVDNAPSDPWSRRPMVQTIIMGDDLIPRVSLRSLRALRVALSDIELNATARAAGMREVQAAGAALADFVSSRAAAAGRLVAAYLPATAAVLRGEQRQQQLLLDNAAGSGVESRVGQPPPQQQGSMVSTNAHIGLGSAANAGVPLAAAAAGSVRAATTSTAAAASAAGSPVPPVLLQFEHASPKAAVPAAHAAALAPARTLQSILATHLPSMLSSLASAGGESLASVEQVLRRRWDSGSSTGSATSTGSGGGSSVISSSNRSGSSSNGGAVVTGAAGVVLSPVTTPHTAAARAQSAEARQVASPSASLPGVIGSSGRRASSRGRNGVVSVGIDASFFPNVGDAYNEIEGGLANGGRTIASKAPASAAAAAAAAAATSSVVGAVLTPLPPNIAPASSVSDSLRPPIVPATDSSERMSRALNQLQLDGRSEFQPEGGRTALDEGAVDDIDESDDEDDEDDVLLDTKPLLADEMEGEEEGEEEVSNDPALPSLSTAAAAGAADATAAAAAESPAIAASALSSRHIRRSTGSGLMREGERGGPELQFQSTTSSGLMLEGERGGAEQASDRVPQLQREHDAHSTLGRAVELSYHHDLGEHASSSRVSPLSRLTSGGGLGANFNLSVPTTSPLSRLTSGGGLGANFNLSTRSPATASGPLGSASSSMSSSGSGAAVGPTQASATTAASGQSTTTTSDQFASAASDGSAALHARVEKFRRLACAETQALVVPGVLWHLRKRAKAAIAAATADAARLASASSSSSTTTSPCASSSTGSAQPVSEGFEVKLALPRHFDTILVTPAALADHEKVDVLAAIVQLCKP